MNEMKDSSHELRLYDLVQSRQKQPMLLGTRMVTMFVD